MNEPKASGPRSSATRSGRVTLAQVALEAGVSRSTAGFVMSGREDQRISAGTWEKVQRAAADLGYRPNLTARILRTGTSGTVGLVSDFISTTAFANTMVRGAMEAVRERDGLLFIAETLGDAALEQRLVQNLLDREVDGVIYASMFTRTVSVPQVLRTNVEVVLLNCVSLDFEAPTVVPDEVGAGASAARLLLDAGHRDGIHFVGDLPSGLTGGRQWHSWAPRALPERLAGIESELATAGVELAGRVLIESDWDAPNGRRAVAQLLADGVRPTALVCVNDAVAFGAYQALAAAGLQVPSDVSVVGFDDSELSRWLEPALTSIALPQRELGRTAVELLREPDPAGLRRLPMPVRARASVAPPR